MRIEGLWRVATTAAMYSAAWTRGAPALDRRETVARLTFDRDPTEEGGHWIGGGKGVAVNQDDDTACDHYLRNRLDYLDYQSAIQQGPPIGSGEIESAHRYIIQERIKLPGTW